MVKIDERIWHKSEDEIDACFDLVNARILKLAACIFITSYLELARIHDFWRNGFNVIDFFADFEELLPRRPIKVRDSPTEVASIYRNYQYHLPTLAEAKRNGWLRYSIDATGLSKERVLVEVMRALGR